MKYTNLFLLTILYLISPIAGFNQTQSYLRITAPVVEIKDKATTYTLHRGEIFKTEEDQSKIILGNKNIPVSFPDSIFKMLSKDEQKLLAPKTTTEKAQACVTKGKEGIVFDISKLELNEQLKVILYGFKGDSIVLTKKAQKHEIKGIDCLPLFRVVFHRENG